MNILVAPDSFKGSITAVEFCDIVESAAKKINKDINIIKFPMADGGEGTVDSLVINTSGRYYEIDVTDPTGEKVKAKYGILGDGKTAVIEMASASGLPLVPEEKRNPFILTTKGTGELIIDALNKGCSKVIMGIGGSATNDGGAGMLQELGFELLNKKEEQIKPGAEGLLELEIIKTTNKNKGIADLEIITACDVNNPLFGKNGAAYVYALQKGAKEQELQKLDEALINFDRVIKKDLKKDVSNVPGAGAAGGLGAGLIGFMNSKLKPGFKIIKDITKFESTFVDNKIDLIITGEGQINYQSLMGKLPVEVAKIAKKFNIPVIAICGSVGESAEKTKLFIDEIYEIKEKDMSVEESIIKGKELLYRKAYNIILNLYI